MTKKEFLDLKRRIDKLLQKAEDEALKEGVDITSEEFQRIFRELKRKLLAQRGVSLEDYEGSEIKARPIGKIGEAFDSTIEGLQGEYSQKIDELMTNFNQRIQELIEKHSIEKEELLSKINVLSGELEEQKRGLIEQDNKIKKQNILAKKEKERNLRAEIRKDTEILKLQEQIQEQAKQSVSKEMLKDIIKSQKALENEGRKNSIYLKNIEKKDTVSPEDVEKLRKESKKEIQKEIKSYIGNWYQLPVRGLRRATQKSLDAFKSSFVDSEIPAGTIDGSNKVFTLANTPISGSVKVFVNGVRLKSGGEDYTISGKTITFGTAPPTGSILLSDYRK